ncbi:MAG: hypothetical protein V5A66_02705 [Candidatus Thermoplasmatota archaeon]
MKKEYLIFRSMLKKNVVTLDDDRKGTLMMSKISYLKEFTGRLS